MMYNSFFQISNLKRGSKAFTLIELLAVIVILAVIALITTPIILNIVNKSKKSAFTDTVYGIIESARLYYTEQILDERISTNKEFKFDGDNELGLNGTKPKGGSLILTDKGEISLAIHNGIWCATKAKNESKVSLKKYEESTCTIPDDIEVPTTPEKKEFTFDEIMNESSEVMRNDPDHNPRYVGSNPNNYVSFNNELWRIIGVFNGQVKIVRNSFYSTSKNWNTTTGSNNWSISTLQTELNGTYLNRIESVSKSYIDENYIWKLGGSNASTGNTTGTRSKLYSAERGTSVASGNPTTWKGAIALMYPSDYGYATSSTDSVCNNSLSVWSGATYKDCWESNWLNNSSYIQWTLTHNTSNSTQVYRIQQSLTFTHSTTASHAVRPCLYLKKNVKINGGDGSSNNPFLLFQKT